MRAPLNLRAADVQPETALRLYAGTKMLASGCMIWQRMRRKVYGHSFPLMSVKGRQRSVRNVAWYIKTDDPLPTDGVSPSCGNDLCVAPSHMQSRSQMYDPTLRLGDRR